MPDSQASALGIPSTSVMALASEESDKNEDSDVTFELSKEISTSDDSLSDEDIISRLCTWGPCIDVPQNITFCSQSGLTPKAIFVMFIWNT